MAADGYDTSGKNFSVALDGTLRRFVEKHYLASALEGARRVYLNHTFPDDNNMALLTAASSAE